MLIYYVWLESIIKEIVCLISLIVWKKIMIINWFFIYIIIGKVLIN